MEIKWRDEYNIGDELIDSQHQNLVNMINILGTAREEGKAGDVLKDILTGVVDYTNFHFSTEENHMYAHHYPVLTIHKSQHKVLINQIIKILEDYKSGKSNAADELLKVLQHWLIKHVLDHDHQYGNFLKSKKTE
jgi:hemerythrin